MMSVQRVCVIEEKRKRQLHLSEWHDVDVNGKDNARRYSMGAHLYVS